MLMLPRLYVSLYALAILGWTALALGLGARNCAGKHWAFDRTLPVEGCMLALGAAGLLWARFRMRKNPPPAGELLMFSVVLAIGSSFLVLFLLTMMHQDCC